MNRTCPAFTETELVLHLPLITKASLFTESKNRQSKCSWLKVQRLSSVSLMINIQKKLLSGQTCTRIRLEPTCWEFSFLCCCFKLTCHMILTLCGCVGYHTTLQHINTSGGCRVIEGYHISLSFVVVVYAGCSKVRTRHSLWEAMSSAVVAGEPTQSVTGRT